MQRLTLFLFSTLLFCYSCQSGSDYSNHKSLTESANADYAPEPQMDMDDDFEMEENYNENGNARSKQSKYIERKIIRNAQVNMQVKDIQEAYPKIERTVKRFDGYISNSNMQNNSNRISNNIVIRVPNENLDTLLRLIENQAIFIKNSSINSTDVTEEFIDIEARLKTKKEVQKRYLDILSKKAKTVEEVLMAEEQIRVLTEEIEAKEGRLRYLNNRVGLSTLSLSIYQKVEYAAAPAIYEKTFFIKIKESFLNGWEIVLNLLLNLVNIWPLVILFLLVIWKRKAIWEKIRRK